MSDLAQNAAQTISLPLEAFKALLEGFYERGDQLFARVPGEYYPAQERVDLYTISGHAEALQSGEIDGDLWGTLEDIEESAQDEAEAWHKIKRFYLSRGYYLLQLTDTLAETEEWIFAPEVLKKLGLALG